MSRKKTRRAPVATDRRFKKRMTADMGPPERWQHAPKFLQPTEAAGVLAACNSEEHVLDRLLQFALIEERQRDAGMRLMQDYVAARIAGSLTASYAGPHQGHPRDAEARLLRSEAQEAAYSRWRRALASLPPTLRDEVIGTVCMGLLPKMEKLGRLKEGLQYLAAYYR